LDYDHRLIKGVERHVEVRATASHEEKTPETDARMLRAIQRKADSMRPSRSLTILALALVAAILPGTVASSSTLHRAKPIAKPVRQGDVFTFASAADAFVISSLPDQNFGSRFGLRVSKSPETNSYIRFDVSDLPGKVTQATLSLYSTRTDAVGADVHGVSNVSWDEHAITYANAPTFSEAVSSTGPVTEGTWTDVDVTSLVTGNGGVAMAFTRSAQGRRVETPIPVRFGSRENTYPPKLSVKVNVGAAYPVRGVYGNDGTDDYTLTVSSAYNVVPVDAYRDYLDRIQADGLKGIVWLGAYDNDTCTFQYDDQWVINHVKPIAGHPAILAYQMADEPLVTNCPTSPGQIKRRSDLVHQLDPGSTTFLTVQEWDGVNSYPYAFYAGTTDVMGPDIYPCSYKHGCEFNMIDEAIQALKDAGVTRYWAIMQGHADDWYRLPTADDVNAQFDHWRKSPMEGYLVFSWNWGDQGSWLRNHPELVTAFSDQNHQ
jgi:hypothetical protein